MQHIFNDCKGYKLAYITSLDKLYFRSLFSGTYKHDDRAICDNNCNVPSIECKCGFYSFKNIGRALKERRFFRGSYIIEVENFGKIVEHQEGYRSEEQVVSKIHLPKKCANVFCYRQIYALVEVASERYKHLCEKDAHKYKNIFNLFYIKNILDIDVILY